MRNKKPRAIVASEYSLILRNLRNRNLNKYILGICFRFIFYFNKKENKK